jgi:hypothetical protein
MRQATFIRLRAEHVTSVAAEMEAWHESARLMRSHPPHITPARVRERLRDRLRGLEPARPQMPSG